MPSESYGHNFFMPITHLIAHTGNKIIAGSEFVAIYQFYYLTEQLFQMLEPAIPLKIMKLCSCRYRSVTPRVFCL